MSGKQTRLPKAPKADARDELVFEGRHKEYGAYRNRIYQRSFIRRGFIAALLLFLFILYLPTLVQTIKHRDRTNAISIPLSKTSTRLSAPPKLPEPPDNSKNEGSAVKSLFPAKKGIGKPKVDSIAEKLKKDTFNASKDTALVIDTTGPERMPMFAGGNVLIADFIKTHLQYPWAEKESGIQGTAEVTFTVNEDGTLSDIETTGQVSIGINHEAERLISIMPPWWPAKHLNKRVKTTAKLDIEFKL